MKHLFSDVFWKYFFKWRGKVIRVYTLNICQLWFVTQKFFVFPKKLNHRCSTMVSIYTKKTKQTNKNLFKNIYYYHSNLIILSGPKNITLLSKTSVWQKGDCIFNDLTYWKVRRVKKWLGITWHPFVWKEIMKRNKEKYP